MCVSILIVDLGDGLHTMIGRSVRVAGAQILTIYGACRY